MVDIVERKVYLLAHSQPTYHEDLTDWEDAVDDFIPLEALRGEDFGSAQGVVMEFAGRTCYDAYGRKNPDTAQTRDYLANIMDQHHRSVLEHSSYTFLLKNISRSATHEIVRHRMGSFSQESQRFVHGRNRNVVAPEGLSGLGGFSDRQLEVMGLAFDYNESMYNDLKDTGHTHKEASEAARSLLPNAAATALVVTMNSRSWVEFIEKRMAPGADAELQAIAREILNNLEIITPEIFDEEARSHWDGNEIQNAPK